MSETPLHLNARSPLAGRAYGCAGRGWGGGGLPIALPRIKPADASPLKLRHSYEGIAAFFEMLLEKVSCADGGAGEYS